MTNVGGLKRQALLAALIGKMDENGSWCGEAHIQKANYFFECLLNVPTEYDFIFYKHGPYSFDLHDDLNTMRGNNLLRLQAYPPYGPSVEVTDNGENFKKKFPKTIKSYEKQLDFIAKHLATENVSELERLATALWVTLDKDNVNSGESRADLLVELKPHINAEQAEEAVQRVDQIIKESKEISSA